MKIKVPNSLLLSFCLFLFNSFLYVHRALVSHFPLTPQAKARPLCYFACMHALLLPVCVVYIIQCGYHFVTE